MDRNSAGMLALALALSVVAGKGVKSSPPSGKTAGTPAAENKTVRVDSAQRHLPAQRCNNEPTSEATSFKSDLLNAVQLTFSEGSRQPRPDCPKAIRMPPASRADTSVIFAILPDPVHTKLPLFFDRQIDALQQGALDSGWIFERALMPWDNKDHAESADFKVRFGQELFQAQQENEPGLLIFRHDPGEHQQYLRKRLFVFVIGESPTGGVRKAQYREALNIVRQLFGRGFPERLLILGPTFSGSLPSLAELLRCNHHQDFPCDGGAHPAKAGGCKGKAISVYSGTVTGRASIEAFKSQLPCVSFSSLEENDEYGISLLGGFLRARGYRWSDVAILSEDESAYGSTGLSRNATSSKCEVSEAALSGNAESEDPDNQSGALHLAFPREISQLRTAYQAVQRESAPESKAPRTTLPLDLEAPGSDDDTVKQYSQRQLPLSQEAVLMGLVAELRAHSTKIVVLRATDPMDQLFLSRYLRGGYPQARIVVVGADLLFARELEDARLHGVMALGTYSLTAGAYRRLSDQEHSDLERVFPGSDAAGFYNATKLLLAVELPVVVDAQCLNSRPADSTHTVICADLFQYSGRATEVAQQRLGNLPAVRLSVLGHGGFWELATLPEPSLSSSSKHGETTSTLPLVWYPRRTVQARRNGIWRLRGVWLLVWFVTVVACSLYACSIWFGSMLSGIEGVAHLSPPRFDSRLILFGVTAYLHFALFMAVIWPYQALKHIGIEIIVGFVVALLLMVVASVDLIQRGRNSAQSETPKITWAHSIAVTLLICCALTFGFQMYIGSNTLFSGSFLWRSIHLTSGVSPVLSILLLLIAWLWWAWYSFSGSALVDERRPLLPGACQRAGSAPRGEQVEGLERYRSILEVDQRMLLGLLRPVPDGQDIAVAGFLMIAVLCVTNFRPVLTLEPNGYDFLIGTLLLVTLALLIVGVVRLQRIWMNLRRLLTALDSFPIRRAFRRLSGFSWSPMWQLGAGNLGDFRRLLTRQAEALRCVFQLTVPGFAALGQSFEVQGSNTRTAYNNAWDHFMGPKSNLMMSRAEVCKTQMPFVRAVSSPETSGIGVATGAAPAAAAPESRWRRLWKKMTNRTQAELDSQVVANFEELQRLFATAGLHALAFTSACWDTDVEAVLQDNESGVQSSTSRGVTRGDSVSQKRLAACEQFLALQYTTFIQIVLVRIRTMIIAIGGVYVLLLVALSSYPFQPQVLIRVSLLILFVFVVATVGTVYAQMHRDATLSNITNSKGSLGTDFWMKIISFVALPGLGLVASQFPELSNLLYSWVEPAMHAFN